ncbi:hypothetical protein WS65_15445 [Burkholderia anthina]|nr:hypothetical protein WS65_15445 [Burkholderia anthina]
MDEGHTARAVRRACTRRAGARRSAKPTNGRRPAVGRAAPSRAAYGSIGDRNGEAGAGFAGRTIAGQEGATRVMRRRAAGTWLPSRVWSFFIVTG